MNAPWMNQCFCGPVVVPKTLPPNFKVTDAERLPDGSFVLTMDDIT